MSPAYRFAPDALLSFRELDVELQEHCLDLLEELAENPWRMHIGDDATAVVDADVQIGGQRFVVFLDLLSDSESGGLTVLGVGAARRGE